MGYEQTAVAVKLGNAFAREGTGGMEQNAYTVVEHAGFVTEGTFRDDVIIDGKAYDMVFMGILKEDWEKRRL